jgi:hypothetical protein
VHVIQVRTHACRAVFWRAARTAVHGRGVVEFENAAGRPGRRRFFFSGDEPLLPPFSSGVRHVSVSGDTPVMGTLTSSPSGAGWCSSAFFWRGLALPGTCMLRGMASMPRAFSRVRLLWLASSHVGSAVPSLLCQTSAGVRSVLSTGTGSASVTGGCGTRTASSFTRCRWKSSPCSRWCDAGASNKSAPVSLRTP